MALSITTQSSTSFFPRQKVFNLCYGHYIMFATFSFSLTLENKLRHFQVLLIFSYQHYFSQKNLARQVFFVHKLCWIKCCGHYIADIYLLQITKQFYFCSLHNTVSERQFKNDLIVTFCAPQPRLK